MITKVSSRTALRWALVFMLLTSRSPIAAAQQGDPTRDELDGYLGRLVTEMRSDVSDLEGYEPLLVLHVLHDERGYRVQASDLLERRLADALAAQQVRVIDPVSRQRILEDLEACYTDEAPFCRASDVVGQFQMAGGVLEGSVLPVRSGTELRLKLVVAGGASGYSAGEIVGTWRIVVPPPSLDPVVDLLPAAGVIAYGRPAGDSIPRDQLGQLRVDVRTEDGTQAWVQIDSRVVVPAPVTTAIGAGEHLLTVTAAGYRPFSDYVEIAPRAMTRRDIVLERGVGTVRVTANARDAIVYLDGQRVGTTPWRGNGIATGPHSVRLEKNGFVEYELDFMLEHDEDKRIEVDLVELPGAIVITCAHDDVTVFMDDAANGPVGQCSTGRTLTLEEVPPGRHTLWGARGPDRTQTMTVTVRGGQAVPLGLGLLLGLPPEAREANSRRSNREYEPYGGRRLQRGLYLAVAVLAGPVDWQMTLDGASRLPETMGYGARVSASFFAEPWEMSLSGDYVFLEDFDEFTNGRFMEFSVGLTGYFLSRSPLRPFVGVRGLYNYLLFDDPLRSDAPELTAGSLGLGAHGGLNWRLSPRTALEFGASYSWAAPRDLKSEGTVGRIEDFQYIAGFAAVWIFLQ